jgi:hypothetical protein
MLAEALGIIGKDLGEVALWRVSLAERWLAGAPSRTAVGAMYRDSAIVRFFTYEQENMALERLCEVAGDVATNLSELSRGVSYLISAIKLISFRAEEILVSVLRQKVSRLEQADFIMRDLFTRPADLIPDWTRETLTIKLRASGNPVHAEVLRHLCETLNTRNTRFPCTNLLLDYEYSGDV